MNDPIVDEVRQAREARAARFNYDLDAIFLDIKEREKKSGRKFVSFSPSAAKPTGPAQGIVPVAAVSPVAARIPTQQ